jgi:hypothetical protein
LASANSASVRARTKMTKMTPPICLSSGRRTPVCAADVDEVDGTSGASRASPGRLRGRDEEEPRLARLRHE